MTKKISISKGNAKMGAIPSVSLPAVVTCNPSAPCFKLCYAAKVERLYKTAKTAYQNNLDVLRADPVAYWDQVKAAAITSRFFRYHVSGDIPDAEYLAQMVRLAAELPTTHFLAFTKQFDIINAFIDNGGVIPNNLTVILSNWGAWKCDNPHGLPVCEIIFKGDTVPDDWYICGGNCTECACRGVGCWQLKSGDAIAILKH